MYHRKIKKIAGKYLIINNKISKKLIFSNRYDALICTLGLISDQSPCDGDIGASLIETKNGKTFVIGITSYPSKKVVDEEGDFIACSGDDPTLYTRISKFWNWAKTIIHDDYCS